MLRVTNDNLVEITSFLHKRRTRAVKKMEVGVFRSNLSFNRKLLKTMARRQNLRDVDFKGTDFTCVPSKVLLNALTKLEIVRNLKMAQMTSEQVTDLLTEIGKGSQLKRLILRGGEVPCNVRSVSFVNPMVLAKALTQLEELDSSWNNLSPQHWEAIFALIGTYSRLKKVEIFDNLRYVDPHVLAAGLNRLEDVSIYFTKVTLRQVRVLLSEIRKGTRLTKLSLERIDLSSLSASLVSEAVHQVREINLSSTSLTSDQIEKISAIICKRSNKLRKLSISSNSLSDVDLDLLADGLMELEEVEAANMELTPEQAFVLVAAFAASRKLRNVNLELNDLSSVESSLLARVVGNVEEINLGSTCLGVEQLEEICSKLCEATTTVKKISLWRSNVSKVDQVLLSKALLQVSEVDLTSTKITEHQALALFDSLKEKGRLKKLKLAWNPNLWRIKKTEAMAIGLNELESVDLFGGWDVQGNSNLPTVGHVTRILKQSLVNTKLRKINFGKIRGGEVNADLVERAKEVIDHITLF